MPATACSIAVDPQGRSVTVNIVQHVGATESTPAIYTSQTGATELSMPATINSETEFWLTAPGDYEVSVLRHGDEIAGEEGATARREVARGQRWQVVPEVDVKERDLLGVGAGIPFVTPRPKRSGTVQTMAAGHGWVKWTAGGTMTDDTTEPCLSSQSLRVDVAAGATCMVRKKDVPAFDAAANYVGIWVKVDEMESLTELSFYLTSTAGDLFTDRVVVDLDATGGTSRYTTPDGFTLVLFSATDGTASGTPNLAAIVGVQVRVVASAAASVWIGGIATFSHPSQYPNGVVSLTFDDSWASQDTLGRPILEKYGIPATCYTIVGSLGQTNKLSLEDLKRLRDVNGWDVAGHAFTASTHADRFPSLGASGLAEEFSALAGWLAKHGFSAHLSYPGGVWEPNISDEFRRHFWAGRTILQTTREVPVPANPERLRAVSAVSSAAGGTPVATVQGYVDDAYDGAGWLIIALHAVVDGTPSAETEISTTDLDSLCSYIATKGIAVRTVSEVLHGR